jgi:RHS repeat-associated protein
VSFTGRAGAAFHCAVVVVAGVVAAFVVFTWSGSASAPAAGVAQADRELPPLSGDRAPALGDELPALRTRTSRTYAAEDGERVAQIFPGPVNYRDEAGSWQAIDSSLVASPVSGYAARNRANDWTVDLPQELAARPVRVSRGDASVEFSLQGGRGAPTVQDRAGTYSDALPGVDVRYDVLPQALKETLLLANAGAGSTFRFSVQTSPGLTAREAHGGVEFMRGDTVAMSVPAPVVWDSAADAREERRARFDLAPVAGGYELTLSVDEQWLKDPARAWPVSVDPYLVPSPTRDCTIKSGSPSTSFCGASTLQVGWDGSSDHRALMYFDLSGLPEQVNITDAYIALYITGQSTGNFKYQSLLPVTRSWTNNVTWNSYDGTNAWVTAGGEIGSPSADTSGIPSGSNVWSYWNQNSLAQEWHDGGSTNHGVVLKNQVDHSTNNVVSYASFDNTNASLRPYMSVNYAPRIGLRRQYTYDKREIDDRSGLAVNVANGNLVVSSSDLQIAGRGLGVDVTRTYNSLSSNDSTTGYAWILTTDAHVTTHGTGDRRFEGPSGYRILFDQQPDGSFKSPPGIDATFSTGGAFGQKLVFHHPERTLYFDTSGFLYKDEDRNGNHVDYSYTSGKLSSITDTQGRTHTYTYAGSGRLDKITDSSGRYVDYNQTGSLLTSAVDGAGKTTSYAYDANNRLQTLTDPRGNALTFAYDSAGRVTSVTRVVDGTTTNDVKTTYAYSGPTGPCNSTDHKGKTVVTDPRGNTTTYCWDSKSRVRLVEDAQSNQRDRTYTANDDVEDFTDTPSGTSNPGTTQLTYDTSGSSPTNNLKGGDLPAGETFSLGYCGDSGLPSCGGGNDKYRPRKHIDTEGSDEFYGYDGSGNLTEVKDDATTPNNKATLEYTNSTDDPSLPEGLLKSATDGEGHETTFEYFTNGNLKKIVPPATTGPGATLGTTEYTYDSLSRVATVTDGNGKVQTFSYDGLDRVTGLSVSSGPDFTFAYDDNGNMTSRTDTAGNTTSYTYDKLNRRLTETFPGARTNTYTYDKAGNLKTLTDGSGTTTYGYDTLNRVTSVDAPNASGSGTDTVSYDYDDASPLRTRETTFPGGATQTTSMDLSGKIVDVLVEDSSGTDLSQYSYDYSNASSPTDRALVQTMTRGNGNTTKYEYKDGAEDKGRLTKATTRDSGANLLEEYRYTYDKAGNRTRKAHEQPAGTTTTTSYAFNAANQMCWSYTGTSSNSCGSPPSGATSYSYDAAGNQTAGIGSGVNASYDNWERTSAFGSNSLTYLTPTQGELVSYGTTSFQNNQLGLGRIFGATTTTDIVREPSGAQVSQRVSAAKRYFLTERLGSTTGLLNSASGGSIDRSYTYTPDGDPTGSGSGMATDVLFAGGHRLAAAGVYHYGARFYDPMTARWIQPDPLKHYADLKQANRYVYAGGDPVNMSDANGTDIFGGIVEVVAGSFTVAGGVIGQAACTVATDGLGAAHCLVATVPVITTGATVVGDGVRRIAEG